MSGRKRTETTSVGLYKVTRTSEPLTIPDLANRLSRGETIVLHDEPLPRVAEWLNNILANIHAIRSDSKQPASVKASAERCSIPATRLLQLLNHMRSGGTHTADFVAQAIEIAAELADEWQSLQVNATLEQPVTKYRKISAAGTRNIDRAKNELRRTEANDTARQAFKGWRINSNLAGISDLTLEDQLKKFISVRKPKRRMRERLNALLKDHRLEK
jgi:hypothetical protein